MYIYEEDECNLFVHHDFEVPAFPLALAWMNLDPRQAGLMSFFNLITFLVKFLKSSFYHVHLASIKPASIRYCRQQRQLRRSRHFLAQH
jgi:type II secretory pathway component PulM